MAKFQVGDKVRDRYTGAEGVVTIYAEVGVTVEWLDDLRRLQVVTFNERRLLLVETAAAAAEGTRVERREPRELRITAPGDVLDELDERARGVKAKRKQREPVAPEDIQTHTVEPIGDDADGEPDDDELGSKPGGELSNG